MDFLWEYMLCKGENDMNYNRFLENSKRTSIIGKNIYTFEEYKRIEERKPPSPGFTGICIGHQLENIKDGVYPEFYENDRKLEFKNVRHRWTPAWQQSYYRCSPDMQYYPNSGCISFCETKCITPEDVFYSQLVLQSDKREPADIKVRLVCPCRGETSLEIKIGALTRGKPLTSKGYVSVKNTISPHNDFVVTVPANGSVDISYCFSFSKKDIDTAERNACLVLKRADVFADNEEHFNKFTEDFVPKLITDNTDILKIYYYRWFLVYRALHKPSEVIDGHPISRHCFYESPYGGWFGCPVGLPVPLHTEETKWMTDPRFVYENTRNWAEGIGYYQEYIQYTPMAIWHLYLNHPSRELLEDTYDACYSFALKSFNPGCEGLEFFKPTEGSWITGAEYQPAFYQHREEKWDWTYDVEGYNAGLSTEISKVYRLDDIVYSIGNLIGCSKIAKQLGKDEDCKTISGLVSKAVALLTEHFWSKERRCFVSVDFHTGKQCDEAVCYDSLYPYLWGIITHNIKEGFGPLTEEGGLACTFGLTTVEKGCPMYWFDNCIAGPTKSSVKEPHIYACSWNGPVWPYALSGCLEALGCAGTREEELGKLWLEYFDRYTELHFLDGDRSAPIINEHYRPTDGYTFSRTCDYFHSTWIDLFMKYWAGIRVDEDGVTFSPLTEDEFEINSLMLGGKKYKFTQTKTDGRLQRTVEVL